MLRCTTSLTARTIASLTGAAALGFCAAPMTFTDLALMVSMVRTNISTIPCSLTLIKLRSGESCRGTYLMRNLLMHLPYSTSEALQRQWFKSLPASFVRTLINRLKAIQLAYQY